MNKKHTCSEEAKLELLKEKLELAKNMDSSMISIEKALEILGLTMEQYQSYKNENN
jgi:hypothetical protein